MTDHVSRYDAADNARKSHALAVKEIRLGNIRTGKFKPRPHVPDEVAAWQEGVRARRIIAACIAAAFAVVMGLAATIEERPPTANGEALAAVRP